MGQSTSTLFQDGGTGDGSTNPLSGEDEKFFSPVQSPCEEEDSSEFEDCVTNYFLK